LERIFKNKLAFRVLDRSDDLTNIDKKTKEINYKVLFLQNDEYEN